MRLFFEFFPLSFFFEFCDRMHVEKSQRVLPFSFFGIVRLFSIFFLIKWFPIRQFFNILKSFCYFWALDMAPTWAGPGLFLLALKELLVFKIVMSSMRLEKASRSWWGRMSLALTARNTMSRKNQSFSGHGGQEREHFAKVVVSLGSNHLFISSPELIDANLGYLTIC